MEIIFNPPVNKANKYISIMVDALEVSGYRVHPLDNFFSGLKHFNSIKLVHLNWFENLDDTSYTKMISSFIKKSLVLEVIRMSGKKLVWTMHNRVSHEKQSGHLSNILTRKLIRYSHAIIIHCSQSRDLLLEIHPSLASKIHYLPHPDFIESYGPVVKENDQNGALKLLFLGAIKPYKNIELLIKTAGHLEDKVELTIAGNSKSEDYKKHLSRFAGIFNNIKLKLEFIPDKDIPKLIRGCDLLVLPYALNSSLNSGTVLLAFSYGKTVICPEIGTLADMKEVGSQFLSYDYESEEEHATKLNKMMETAFFLKKSDPEIFRNMGAKMFQYVKDNHSKKMVTEGLKQVYQAVLKRK
ncbi:glycosyltransferase [Aquiflexum sp. TKW24L]|uniref:glycosyltransferase n=1 Tax=Aquiflexum sp. TKW24L TaxID=2942212 RepID=UPI0020BDE05B|nr:glycosyltransferase [Aquiflexum sp. TKW24L]MCL6260679.1 glycosyltransferase [Aquiflexum sp. TKW24L]